MKLKTKKKKKNKNKNKNFKEMYSNNNGKNCKLKKLNVTKGKERRRVS